MDLVAFYKCLGDSTRLRIAHLLVQGDPLCVRQIQDSIQESQVKTSKHLGYMKSRGLLSVERQANWNFYRIADGLESIVGQSLGALRDHSNGYATLRADLDRLKALQAQDCC